MRKIYFLTSFVFLSAGAMFGQPPGFQNAQVTSGVVGITPGQTARWNVLYPTIPAPVLQVLCTVHLNIADDQGNVLKTMTISRFTAGKSVSLDLNDDTDLSGKPRVQVHAYTVGSCSLPGTLEVIDNITQKTVLVVPSKQTYPPVQAVSAAN